MILAFDIGGTKIAAGLVDEADMRIVSALSRPSPNHHLMKGATRIEILHALGAELRAIFEQFAHEHAIEQCSIAFPAAVDAYENVHRAPTLWGDLDGPPVSLRQVFSHVFPSLRLHFLNDVTASGYACVQAGHKDFAVFTVGSGVGCKVFVDGECKVGPRSRGGEIGHLVVDHAHDALVCDCGARGHLGAMSSGRGMLAASRRWLQLHGDQDFSGMKISRANVTNELLVQGFMAEAHWAVAICAGAAHELGRVLATLHLSVGLERFFFMGGMVDALGPGFLGLIADSARQQGWDDGGTWADWVRAVEGDNPALRGAAFFAKMKRRPNWGESLG